MKVKFNNVEINSDYIMSLSQEGILFTENFKLGTTVCRIINLQISKLIDEDTKLLVDLDSNGFFLSKDTQESDYYLGVDNVGGYVSQDSSDDYKAYIDDEGIYLSNNLDTNELIILDNDNQIFKGYIDEVSENNDKYYNYVFADSMIKLNVSLAEIFNWTVDVDYTVQDIVDKICDYINSNRVTVDYIGNLVMTWDYETSARDFLGYVAEIMGGFARIDGSGNIEIVPFKSLSKQTIDFDTCKDISIGEQHHIDRVGFNTGVNSYFYPLNPTQHNTVYINEANILLTDSGGYTIQDIIQHIYSQINGFIFYPVKSTRCELSDSVLPGDIITFYDGLNSYPTIAQINWNYINGWKGGYELEVNNEQQEETSVNSSKNLLKNIKIKVDRELNIITQKIQETEEEIRLISVGIVNSVDVVYGQGPITLPPTIPTNWHTLPPQWDDSKQMWEKSIATLMNTSTEENDPSPIYKEDGKTVYSITELYYCTGAGQLPSKPTTHIYTTANIYNEWTKVCPTRDETYPIYYTCSEINYTDGTYSWSDPHYVAGIMSNEKLYDRIEQIESNISSINQRANGIELSVQEINETSIPDLEARTQILETCVSIQTEGVRISQGTMGAYTLLTDDGMEIYAEGNKVAFAKNDGFYAIDYIMNGWHMITANDNNSFCFVRKEYN